MNENPDAAPSRYFRVLLLDYGRNPCKWIRYRILGGKITYIEYFPGALDQFYGGVSGYLYSCEGEFPLNDKLGLAAGVEGEVALDDCETVADVRALLLSCEREGRLLIRRHAALADGERTYIRESVARLIGNLDLKRHPENPYHAFVCDGFPDVWDQSDFSR